MILKLILYSRCDIIIYIHALGYFLMNFIDDVFKKTVSRCGTRTALADRNGTRKITYAELDSLSGHVAGKLHSLGYGQGDFILINAGRCIEYMAAYIGILKAGCAVVPVVPDYPKERIDFMIGNCDAKAVITEDFFIDVTSFYIYEAPADGDAPALLAYTSGSTGTPKGILHSTGDLARAGLRHAALYKDASPLIFASTAPFSFLAHIIEYIGVFASGGTVHIIDDITRKDINALTDYIADNGITMAWMVPQLLRVYKNTPHKKNGLQCILSGGERMSRIAPDECRIKNVYGMSETAALITCFDVDRAYENTPIGKALSPVNVIVCDENGTPQKNGCEGEICAVGEFDVIYYKDPERTARAKTKLSDGKTLFHTGDMGMINENGDLVYLNRRDWMVKINGQRVETAEIESLLLGMDEIKNAAVKAFDDNDGHTYLAAYYELAHPLTEAQIAEKLKAKLPDYMIPAFFAECDALPKNANGKLDRLALLPPDKGRYKNTYVAPENDAEKSLCDAFEAVLHCGRVGTNDNFFALGGDSIKVLALIEASKLEALTPDMIFCGKTPKNIASLLSDTTCASVIHSDDFSTTPLTEAQRGVYLECIEAPDSVMYNIPMLCRLPDDTDEERFISAAESVIAHHKAFGVAVVLPDGVPSMRINDADIRVTVKDTDDIEAEARDFIRPFDLENGPLCRFELCRANRRLAFLFDVHHIIFDGTSAQAFISEIASVYNGGDAKDEQLTVFDISRDELTLKDTDKYKEAQLFFKNLENTDCDSRIIPDIVADKEYHGAGRITESASPFFDVDEINAFVKRHGITENTLFLGTFAYALAKFNGMSESLFATVDNGRHDPRLASAVGMFVKTLPMYFNIDESMPIDEYLFGVQEYLFGTIKNDCISFGELAAEYGVNTSTVFVYQGEIFNGASLENGTVDVDFLETGDAQSDLDIMMIKSRDGFELMAHFRNACYSSELIESFAKMYLGMIRGMLTADRLSDVRYVNSSSRLTLDKFNATESPYANSETVVSLFRAQAKRTPDNICVVFEDKKYTYAEIDRITDILAKHLVTLGISKEKVAGVLIPRCEHMVICSLAVLKAGGAYLPLDPTYPKERLDLMVEDSGASLLIFAPEYADIITDDFTGVRLSTDAISTLEDSKTLLPEPSPSDLFVMLYTSGSTGKPKGVMFEHSNALVTTEWVKKYFGIGEASRVTAYASYGFDAHSFDIYPAITGGAQLHIISEKLRLDFLALRDYFNSNGITHTVMTTQIGRQFALLGGFTTLRHLSVAGEKLTPLDPPKALNMYNLYGPTEGSVITSAFRIDKKYKDVPVGTPVDNLKLYVVDKAHKLLPVGAVGELWISGPHVTRGYLNRPDKNAEAYGENPFDTLDGYERVYRTGDIVRLLPDGNIQFVGRRDAQVKIRGFRIELTEIEEVIRRFDGIKDATVAAFDDIGGGKYVAAYIVADKEISKDALAEHILSEKPPYMVPAVIMQIDAIPLNQNGKVNRRALPLPVREAENTVPPETDMQKQLFDIIKDVIGHDSFGITTNIYTAGLTSIGAVKLNVSLAQAFDVPIRLSDIKANDTILKLEAFILASKPQTAYKILPDYPISETQSGIFVECMASPESTVYNIPMLIRLGKNVDIHKLKDAVIQTVNAHPYIKTTLFSDADGNIRARRNDDAPFDIPIIKCAEILSEKALVQPFRLMDSQLFRIEIYETATDNYLFTDFHHIICDGTSESVILRDIDRAYAGEALVPEAFSGFEAALEEQEARKSEHYAEAKAYWEKLLTGCETACLPKFEPENRNGGAGTVTLSFSGAERIKAYCEKENITLNAFFNASFAFVISRFANKESLTYTTVYNGRNDSRLAESVTMLVKTLPLVAGFTDGMRVSDLTASMRSQLIDGMSNDIYSFAEISAAHGVKADIIFVYQGDDFVFDSLCGEKAEMLTIASSAAKAPISVTVYLEGDAYNVTVEYRKDMFNSDFAACLADSFAEASRSLTENEYLRDVSMLSENAEKLYDKLNCNSFDTENIPCHRLFERQAALHPDSLKVFAAGEEITFGELNRRANTVAHMLLQLGVGRENIIGLVFDRTKEMLICELAVMKAGGAFLPMIPTYPDERIDFCLTNADSPFVITTKSIRKNRTELFADEKPYKTLTVEELLDAADNADDIDDGNPDTEILPNQLAYCIYTSGSTGTPKGVMIEHHSFTNFVQTNTLFIDYYNDTDETGIALSLSSYSFDMSMFEIYLPLCFGRSLYIASDEEIHSPLQLKDIMVEKSIGMMVCTPSFMNNMVSMPEFHSAIKKLKSIVVGAEAFPASLYDTLRSLVPSLQIINGYGPTETTVCCSYKVLQSGEGITIGHPTANMKLFVTDKFGNILPPYATGEMIICGAGVGRGYVKLPEKTKASFFRLRGMPAYHSGDLVRLNRDGEIDFGGRIDNQVKLRGFRIELDEIEKVMCAFPPVTQSKVLVRNNGKEDYLVGFFTAEKEVAIDELTAFMKSRLTYYMVPAALMQLDMMPLTPNGKIDKKAFPEVKKQAVDRTKKRAPKKSLEQKLCEIFASVLSLDDVFADDNFFELGGTSLSASKVTMLLMSDGIEVKYGDIFDNPTPELLAEFIQKRDSVSVPTPDTMPEQDAKTRPALKFNTVKYAHEVTRAPLGNVLLTGAVGFLGIHVLHELLKSESGHIWCLVRRGMHETAEIRLKTMLVYYFSNGFEEELKNRITVVEADITDPTLGETLANIPFDTVINCAACVKHFSDSDILTQINVHGVENLISVCKKRDTKLVQISTVSVPGIHTPETYEKQIRMHENELFVIDDMANKYAISKYNAELKMFEAIESGLRGKVIRVGNLMGRHSDGEFQANMETNMFLSGIRGFAVMGKYPISHMTDPMRFSPVDCTARAVILLAGTDDKFTAFNCDNRYGFDEMKIIDACNRNGIRIIPEKDEIYYDEFRKKLGDDRINGRLNGLAAYDIKDAHVVDTDNLFTANILYRIGFSWPLVDDTYLDRAINSIMTLDYFNVEESE